MRLSSDDLPMFFEPAHAERAEALRALAPAIEAAEAAPDEDARNRAAVAALAEDLLARVCRLGEAGSDARGLCLAREALGRLSPRADSILAVHGLGSFALGRAATAEQRAWLEPLADGRHVAAFALTEPGAGSDVAALATRATAAGDGWVLDGEKTFISNLGIATHATVFATVDPAQGRKGITAFWLPLDAPGVTIEPLEPIAPHPLGRLILRGVRLGSGHRVGEVGAGFRLAMETLDAFRVSVGAAAVGMARRALAEAAAHVRARVQFGRPLADQPLVQAHLADMATDLDAARLLVYRAAWLRDHGDARYTTEVSMAKLHATEAAQRIIDAAVQLHGGAGVMAGAVVEQLYRAIRPLRIYEGTSEIQRTIIGRAIAAAEDPA